MRRALSQNPNMLRTIIGLGLTLVLILSYAVYSATLDSAFYLAETSNVESSLDIIEDSSNGTYSFETSIMLVSPVVLGASLSSLIIIIQKSTR